MEAHWPKELVDSDAPLPEVIGPPPLPPSRFRGKFLSVSELAALPPRRPLVAGVLDEDSLAVLFGPPKCGKSFVALSWALSITTGAWWMRDHAVVQGAVVYVAAEGSAGMTKRILAWQHSQNISDPGPLIVLPEPLQLMNSVDVTDFQSQVRDYRPRLIVIDTLARCMVGADENSTKDMGIAVQRLDGIRVATGASVLVVHHTGRTSGLRSRGSNALDGAVDMGYGIERKDKKLKLVRTAAKDHADGNHWSLGLHPVLDSQAITRADNRASNEMTDHARVVLERLDAIDPNRLSVTKAEWNGSIPPEVSPHDIAPARGLLVRLHLVDEAKAGNSTRYKITALGLGVLGGHLPIQGDNDDATTDERF